MAAEATGRDLRLSASAPMPARDLRLDFFRGIALMMIFIDHIPGNVFSHFTLVNVGFSDAAEVFVLIAGISAYFAYGKTTARQGFLRGAAAVFDRVRKLYVSHLVMFVMVTAVSAYAATRFGDPMYLEAMALDSFASEPVQAMMRVITLTYLPGLLDILPLYIVLLSLIPFLLLLLRVHWLAPLAGSAAVYAAARVFEFNLPNYPDARAWYFNPFAWQLLFVTGVTLAHLVREGRWRPPARRAITGAAAAYLAFAFVVTAPWTDLPGLANTTLVPPNTMPPIDKSNLSLWRYANVLAQAWLVGTLIRPDGALFRSFPGRIMVAAGRRSLDVFTLGVVLSVISSVLVREAGYGLGAQMACTFAGLAAMLLYARFLDWLHAGERRDERAATGVPAGPAPAAKDVI